MLVTTVDAAAKGHGSFIALGDPTTGKFGREQVRELRRREDEAQAQAKRRADELDAVVKAMISGKPLDAKDPAHSRGLDDLYEKHFAPDLEGRTAEEQRRRKLDFIVAAGLVPAQVRREIDADLRSGDVGRMASAAAFIDELERKNPAFGKVFDSDDRRMARSIAALTAAGFEGVAAVKRHLEASDLAPDKRTRHERELQRLIAASGDMGREVGRALGQALGIPEEAEVERDDGAGADATMQTLEYDPERDGDAARPRTLELPRGQAATFQQMQGAAGQPRPPQQSGQAQSAQLGVPTGAGGALDEDGGEAYNPDPLTPNSPNDNYGPPWYTPGDWAKQRDPRTAGRTRLVGPDRLTDAQKKNLAERNWIFPTDGEPEYDPVGANYPYFGSRRREGGPSTFHGGYDARFKRPAQGSGQKPNKQVVAATRGRFKGFVQKSSKGTVINKIILDLGDGMELQMLHIEPTPQILAMDRQLKLEEAQAAAAQKAGKPVPQVNYPEIDAGVLLGEVDWPAAPKKGAPRPAPHDHTHMQLMVKVDGELCTVDITPYMERRARRQWRHPTNDWLERRYDDLFGEDLPGPLAPPN